ncbi:M1 family metallopeptidase [Nemorincola caseinilytica]|uniref:M1 family metallopeptidase n=1 Tax=Nemorincola caseinilytica TaxID=2054315 RepID=A0ABP8N716_9BACT
MKHIFSSILLVVGLLAPAHTFAFDRADTLRGSNGRGRSWWDVRRYHLDVRFDTLKESISGRVQIFYKITGATTDSMQIDLQEPMQLDSVFVIPSIHSSRIQRAAFVRDGNAWWILHDFRRTPMDSTASLVLYYHGTPRKAVNPPWDGGFSWRHDEAGVPLIAVSCQGLGASVWWPCKDAQWEEPEQGMRISLEAPANLQAISNGRKESEHSDGSYKTTIWEVRNPINNYDVTFYIGDYVHWSDTLLGEKGKLDLGYYVLRSNEEKARKQFEVVKPMIRCFEYWMGPYPFYEDGYKLVEAPYLGMEHQSAIAYGNDYKMGYKGYDRSLTGFGLKWDYIIIHESGHEWFGNNVTARDMADNWIHEGITSYSEALFTECQQGWTKGLKYSRGLWHNIKNEAPVVSSYGVNSEGTGDIYEKGEAIMHMIRILTGDDQKFRAMLRGLGSEFYHSTVTTAQVEEYIARMTGLKLNAFFDQYLRRKDIPEIEYSVSNGELSYRFTNVVPGFSLPLSVKAGDRTASITVTSEWQKIKWESGYNVKFSEDLLIKVK